MTSAQALEILHRRREFLELELAKAADASVKFSIQEGLRECAAEICRLQGAMESLTRNTAPRVAPSRLPHAAEHLVGREQELRRLDEAWADPQQHVLVIRGIGGEGKTSLVAAWVARLAQSEFQGASYFDWSFYSQGTRDQTTATSEPFIAGALTFFGEEALANSAASARDKVDALLKCLRRQRTLLVLDGLEPLQYPPGPTEGRLRDEAMAALLKGLAQTNPGLCVVTTRETVTDLAPYQATTAPEWELECLSDQAGANLLQRLLEPKSPKGMHQVRSTLPERVEICKTLRGHALTLRLLGGYLHRALRDIRRWQEVDFRKADEAYRTNPKEARYGHAFTTLAAYETWLEGGGSHGARQLAALRLMGLFDREASAPCLQALRAQPPIPGLTEPLCGLSEEDWNLTLSELEASGLVRLPADTGGLDAHPLVREYFAARLREEAPDVYQTAHRRLYEHLCATTQEGERPTLAQLQPLYQAVAHGCLAGMHQEACDEVYHDRILKGPGSGGSYSVHQLGAFGSDLGAVACFFEEPWKRLCTNLLEAAQAWLLNEAAFRLRALGRLREALEPMRAGLTMRIAAENWEQAAVSASNLSELKLTLGEVAQALGDARRSVDYADRSGDADQQMFRRTTHANALHQAGQGDAAEARFREAETLQAEDQPHYPLLYSVRGFQYCDLLLPERGVWRQVLGRAEVDQAPQLQACRAVAERAKQMFEWRVPSDSLLDIALDHLTLGRAALYGAILQGTPPDPASLQPAVDGLRRAGTQDHIPLALLTRAWLRATLGAFADAQADLDEAWEIAERGPMPLFQTDIHLHRARLFFRGEVSYPWTSPRQDLAEARRLIEKCGYGRRLGELEDAEAAVGVRP